jgi:hypothetical protein
LDGINGKEEAMERRFAVRYEELMAEAEVKPEALEGVLGRLKEFVRPFAASLNTPRSVLIWRNT